MFKCIICGEVGGEIGLLPENKRIKLIMTKKTLVTENKIPFTTKSNNNTYHCYGILMHEKCEKILKKKLNLVLTFSALHNFITSDGLLRGEDYLDDISVIWTKFMKKKIRIMRRKQCVNNVRTYQALRYKRNSHKFSTE
jgi:hypothetical protein